MKQVYMPSCALRGLSTRTLWHVPKLLEMVVLHRALASASSSGTRSMNDNDGDDGDDDRTSDENYFDEESNDDSEARDKISGQTPLHFLLRSKRCSDFVAEHNFCAFLSYGQFHFVG